MAKVKQVKNQFEICICLQYKGQFVVFYVFFLLKFRFFIGIHIKYLQNLRYTIHLYINQHISMSQTNKNQISHQSLNLQNQSASLNSHHNNQDISHQDNKSKNQQLNHESKQQSHSAIIGNSSIQDHSKQQSNLNLKIEQNSHMSGLQHNSNISAENSNILPNSSIQQDKKQSLNENSHIQNKSKISSNASIINQQQNKIPSIIHDESINHSQNNFVKQLQKLPQHKQQKHSSLQNHSVQNQHSVLPVSNQNSLHVQNGESSQLKEQNSHHVQNEASNKNLDNLRQPKQNSNVQKEHKESKQQNKQHKRTQQQVKAQIQNTIHQIFAKLDQNKDGKLTLQELDHVAKKLGISSITHEQMEQFIKQADTLKDNKITFQQFKVWYKRYSHVEQVPVLSNLNKLIALKNQHLPKLIKLSSHKSQQEKILSQKIDKINLNFELGDHIQKQSKTKIKFNIHLGLNLYFNQIKDLKQKGIELNQQNFGVVIQFKNNHPQQSKQFLQVKINQLKNSSKQSFISSVDFQCKSTKHLTLLHMTSKKLQQQFKDIIDFMRQKSAMQGQNYFFKAETDLFIKSGIHTSMKEKFINWILNGFKFKVNLQGSSLFLKNLRKSFESEFSSHLVILSLIKQGKIDLKFKTIKSVQGFLSKLGIKQLSEQTPSLEQLFSQLLGYYNDFFKEEKQLNFFKSLLDEIVKISSQKICLSIFIGHLRIYLQIDTDSFQQLSKLMK